MMDAPDSLTYLSRVNDLVGGGLSSSRGRPIAG